MRLIEWDMTRDDLYMTSGVRHQCYASNTPCDPMLLMPQANVAPCGPMLLVVCRRTWQYTWTLRFGSIKGWVMIVEGKFFSMRMQTFIHALHFPSSQSSANLIIEGAMLTMSTPIDKCWCAGLGVIQMQGSKSSTCLNLWGGWDRAALIDINNV